MVVIGTMQMMLLRVMSRYHSPCRRSRSSVFSDGRACSTMSSRRRRHGGCGNGHAGGGGGGGRRSSSDSDSDGGSVTVYQQE